VGTSDKPSSELADLLCLETVLPYLEGGDPDGVITEMVDHLVSVGRLSADLRNRAIDSLLEREERTSTGIGAGVAIPHAFLEEISEVQTVFGRSEKGLDFQSIDNSSVEFVVLFLVPENQHQLHLKTLASIARLFLQEQVSEQLRAASVASEILEVFENGRASKPDREA